MQQQLIEMGSAIFATASLITSLYQRRIVNSLKDVCKHHEHLLNSDAERFQTDLEMIYGDLLDRITDISDKLHVHETTISHQQSSTSATKKELLKG